MMSSSLRFLSYLISYSSEFCLNLINVGSKFFFCFIIFQCQKHHIWILAFIRKLFLVLSKCKNSQDSACFPAVSVCLFFRQDCVNPNGKAVLCACLYLLLFALVDALLMSFFSVNECACHNFLIWMSESCLPGGGTLLDIVSLSIYLLILSFHFPLCYFGFMCSKTSSSLFSRVLIIS